MERNGSRIMRGLEVTAIVFSVVTGASSLGILVWKGGEMSHMVTTHETRIVAIESKGSPTMGEHVKVDEEREKNMKDRMDRLEDIYKVALDMRSEMSRLTQKVDDLKEQLNKKP